MMNKRSDDLDWVFDIRRDEGDLERQIYAHLRDAVLAGRLAAGIRLPSSRSLAANLGVSRGTVVAAFEQLVAEGYLTSQTGRGTEVADVPTEMLGRAGAAGADPGPPPSARAALFARASSSSGAEPRCFRPGIPSLDDFPQKEWSRCLAGRARSIRTGDMAYRNGAGLPLLQETIAAYLNRSRGVVAEASQIVVVPSAQAAFDLAALCCADPGDTVAVEDPGYTAARHVFEAAGAIIAPLPVDTHGARMDRLAHLKRLRLIAVTPSHHYPTGVTMSLSRRLELLDVARSAGAYVLEDDYDSEFHYAERPIASLQGLDGGSRVVYVGTFSKLLAPGLRAAYVVAPPALADPMRDTAIALGQVVSHPVQAAIADFMSAGYLNAHIGRMRPVYQKKRDLLIAALRQHLPESVEADEPRGGLQLLLRLPDGCDDVQVQRELETAGIAVAALSPLCIEEPKPGLLLGFAAPRMEEIAPATRRLADVVRAHI